MSELNYFYAHDLATTEMNDIILSSDNFRNGQPEKSVTVAVVNATGALDDPMSDPEGRDSTRNVYFTSKCHGAPWVRNEKTVDTVVCTLPTSITDYMEQETYFNTMYGNGSGRIKAYMIVPNYDYNQTQWR